MRKPSLLLLLAVLVLVGLGVAGTATLRPQPQPLPVDAVWGPVYMEDGSIIDPAPEPPKPPSFWDRLRGMLAW
jgi:hypothetical protein